MTEDEILAIDADKATIWDINQCLWWGIELGWSEFEDRLATRSHDMQLQVDEVKRIQERIRTP